MPCSPLGIGLLKQTLPESLHLPLDPEHAHVDTGGGHLELDDLTRPCHLEPVELGVGVRIGSKRD